MISVPKYIKSIKPYLPGKPIQELERELGIKGAIKLASNENPLGPSPLSIEAMKNLIYEVNRYPDGSGFYLKKALSEKLNIDENEIILGNGSNEIIDIAVKAFMTHQDEAIMAIPSFVVYPLAVKSIGATAKQIPLKNWRHDLKKMLSAITEKTKIIFIANPNNPTGTINFEDEFIEFMEKIPEGVMIVVDEAYYEYVQDKKYPDSMKFLRQGKDILILRTFSKIYGLAGLRIGYGIAKKEIIMEMNKVREPFNTNILAQAAATAAIKDKEHIKKSIKINEEGKNYLYKEFKELGISYLPTETNFIYVYFNKPIAEELYNLLLRKGVIIRPMGKEAVRITIGLPEEIKRLIDIFKEKPIMDLIYIKE